MKHKSPLSHGTPGAIHRTAEQAKKVGDARLISEAAARSGWDSYYTGRVTIEGTTAAFRPEDIIDCLEGRRPLSDLRRLTIVEDGAIPAAAGGNVSRLVDCLRGRKPLLDDDCNRLADLIETRKRRRRWPDWLVNVLQYNRPLTEADYDRLANFVALELHGRRQGRPRDEAVHRAARVTEVILSLAPAVTDKLRSTVVDYVCEDIEPRANPARVRNLLERPEARRHEC